MATTLLSADLKAEMTEKGKEKNSYCKNREIKSSVMGNRT